MDGPELVKFSLEVVPPLIDRVLAGAKWTRDDVDMFLLHQATLFMLDHLRERLSLDREHTPEALEYCGNTVSSTIPILIRDLRSSGPFEAGQANFAGWLSAWVFPGPAACGPKPGRSAKFIRLAEKHRKWPLPPPQKRRPNRSRTLPPPTIPTSAWKPRSAACSLFSPIEAERLTADGTSSCRHAHPSIIQLVLSLGR